MAFALGTGSGQSCDGEIDWQRFLGFAEHHAVRPLLHRAIPLLRVAGAPQSVHQILEATVRANAQKNLLYAAELLRLSAALRGANVPFASFKGVVLAHSLYGDIGLREFCDLDILVHEDDLGRAEDILAACGYLPGFPDRAWRSAFLGYQYQYLFRHARTGLTVDLHWRLASKGVQFPLDTDEVWSHLAQISLEGRAVPVLGREDLALYLAAHGAKEGWRSLVWVCDFALLLRKHPEIDWEALLERARRAHCSRMLLVACLLAHSLLGAMAPPKLLDMARSNPGVAKLMRQVRINMLRTTPAGEFQSLASNLAIHDRLRHRMWPIATLLSTRTVSDYSALPLPEKLWGVYYLTRPLRLSAKAVQMLFRSTSDGLKTAAANRVVRRGASEPGNGRPKPDSALT